MSRLAYLALNPQGLIPAMELPGGETLGQSVALLEWLEEAHPEASLLPENRLERARVRSVVNNIACDIHPICNIAVTNYLKDHLAAQHGDIIAWYRQWMHRGFQAVEQAIGANGALYSFGDQPGMADVCLVPQVYNARRFDIPLNDFPVIQRTVDKCNKLSAFRNAAPERQPDSNT